MWHKRKKRGLWRENSESVCSHSPHDHGAILCEWCEEQLTGQFFADFVTEHFENAFENSCNPRGKFFLLDGDLSQNSLKAKNAVFDIGARMLPIPPRSQLKTFSIR